MTRFAIWSVEDGLAEDDRQGWAALIERIGAKVQLVVGDVSVNRPGHHPPRH